jgi:hypothetical protein
MPIGVWYGITKVINQFSDSIVCYETSTGLILSNETVRNVLRDGEVDELVGTTFDQEDRDALRGDAAPVVGGGGQGAV